MGILRELLHDFTFGLVDRESGDDDQPYRCISCGAGLDRNYRACPECGNEFVAPVDDDDGGADESGPPGPGPGQ